MSEENTTGPCLPPFPTSVPHRTETARCQAHGCGESPSLSCSLISLPLPVRILLLGLFSGSQTSSGFPRPKNHFQRSAPAPHLSSTTRLQQPAFKAMTLHTHEERRQQWPAGGKPQPSRPARGKQYSRYRRLNIDYRVIRPFSSEC